MPFPIKTCVICHEEFELRPGKPGFANRCPSCSEPEESSEPQVRPSTDYAERRAQCEAVRDHHHGGYARFGRTILADERHRIRHDAAQTETTKKTDDQQLIDGSGSNPQFLGSELGRAECN